MKRLSEIKNVSGNVERLWAGSGTDQAGRAELLGPPSSSDQEIRRLEEELVELKTSFEKANRRINRLLGEKNQLSALLDKRDEQIQSLNRELGGYEVSKTVRFIGVGRTLTHWTKALATLTGRVSSRIAEAPAAKEHIVVRRDQAKPTAKLRSPLISRLGSANGEPMVAVLLFGLDRERITQLLPMIERDCSERKATPLCLVDSDAFELFRVRGIVFEYLPPCEDRERFDSSLHWDLYIQRRLALIRQKWNPSRVVAFGPQAMELLTLWSSSPFETSPLPASSSASAALA